MHLRSVKKTFGDVSINDTLGTDKDGNEITYIDVIKTDGEVYDEVEKEIEIKRLRLKMSEILSDREIEILKMRFGLHDTDEKPQREIAQMLGISRSYVSRIEKKALAKLSKELKLK